MAIFGTPNGGCRKAGNTDHRATAKPDPAPLDDARAAKPTGPPRTDERQADRDAMVSKQIEARDVRDANVLAAMRNVPRHWFVPGGDASRDYLARPLPSGHGQTLSQPYIGAKMTELLELMPG